LNWWILGADTLVGMRDFSHQNISLEDSEPFVNFCEILIFCECN